LQSRPCKTHFCSNGVSVIMVLSMAIALCANRKSNGHTKPEKIFEITAFD
jgi:hypothetical protein